MATTCFLAGLIWVIQRVHYPLMSYVADDPFPEFEEKHCKRIGQIVLPAMLLELSTSLLALWYADSTPVFVTNLIGVLLLAIIWCSTFAIQVPIHNRLGRMRNLADIEKLTSTNWIRTSAWSLRALTSTLLVWQVGAGLK